jgi:hypothetical protein
MLLEFYVEEQSAETALIHLVPNILRGYQFEFDIFPFQGKHAMLRHLPNRLKAYQHRSEDDWRVIVLIDRDSADCTQLKQKLEQIAQGVGLVTRTQKPDAFRVINRIAIEELEAWFFGDVEAMVRAYPKVDSNLGKQAGFRDSDAIKGGTWEQLEKVLVHYHPGGLEKIRAADEIAQQMLPERNTSKSFQVFRDALLQLFEVEPGA